MKLSKKDLEKRGTLHNIRKDVFVCPSEDKLTDHIFYDIWKKHTYMLTIGICESCGEASYVP